MDAPITKALQHCLGIGPVRLTKLHDLGVHSWFDVLERPSDIPSSWLNELCEESKRCLAALDAEDIGYFAERFVPQDKWRILDRFLDRTTFFDIETDGLDYDSSITVIVCWHKGQLHTFVEHENLDDFLDLLDDVDLLASFNGNSFDVPRILDAFHIPDLPCPHLDLRWICYHQGHSGGLKDIARRLNIVRPADLEQADGELAIQLWTDWRYDNDQAARDHLIRYCAADVLMLVVLANELVGHVDMAKHNSTQGDIWEHLPKTSTRATSKQISPPKKPLFKDAFGYGNRDRLRAIRTRFSG